MRPVEPYCVRKDNLYMVPVCHYRMEFALHVNRAVERVEPDCIAVELPSTLDWHIKKAVERFPFLSVIFYQNGKGDYIYFPIEPADPLCEGVRSGLELKIPVHCIDLDTDDYPLIFDPMPDSYAVRRLGLKTYYETYLEAVKSGEKPRISTSWDARREQAMAHRLKKLLSMHKKVLFICGMAHGEGVLQALESPSAVPLGKAVRKDLRIFNPDPDSIREITGEIPFIISLYETVRGKHDVDKEIEESAAGAEGADEDSIRETEVSPGAKVISLEERRKNRDKEAREKSPEEMPVPGVTKGDDLSVTFGIEAVRPGKIDSPGNKTGMFNFPFSPAMSDGLQMEITGLSREESPGIPPSGKQSANEEARQKSVFRNFMKRIFGKLFEKPEKNILFGTPDPEMEKQYFDQWFSLFDTGPQISRENIHKFRASEDRRSELLRFYRYLTNIQPDFDRQMFFLDMIKQAAKYYAENVNEEIRQWQIRVFMKYARNLARVTGGLMPDLYQLIVCARGCADDNFAYEVWDLATYYPWRDHSGEYQSINIRADEVWLNGKKITLRRKFPYLRKKLMKVPVRERKNECRPGEWAEKYDGNWICSYPPEDIVIEDYGTYLRKKGMNIINEENTRVMPFTTSLLDGVDIRETLRNWHEKKLYVREEIQMQGGVGSVVVVFDEDPDDGKFPWKLTWLGEHHQESDMAFYATHPADKIVGPGISRCSYGGFMMTYPPQRMWDVWNDYMYSQAKSKSETLLMAAIEYSMEKNVVYLAAKPPRSFMKTFANRLGKRIIYVPIGQLSPVSLKKIRVFHVLSGHQVREFAKEYVW